MDWGVKDTLTLMMYGLALLLVIAVMWKTIDDAIPDYVIVHVQEIEPGLRVECMYDRDAELNRHEDVSVTCCKQAYVVKHSGDFSKMWWRDMACGGTELKRTQETP